MNWESYIRDYPGLEQLVKWKIRWNDLVNKGTAPFDPLLLREALSKFAYEVDLPINGKKILKLEKKGRTFIRCSKTKKNIKNYEIALQVFIQEKNDRCYAQYQLTGDNQNWDIVNVSIDNVAEFIELKEWDSNDCPLYALVEVLKNLELFRYVSNSGRYGTPSFKPGLISILAPISYYEDNDIIEAKKSHVRKRLYPLIEDCEKQFNIVISFKAIDLSKSDFDEMCSKAKRSENQNKIKRKMVERATVENIKIPIPELLVEKWKLIL